MRSYKIFTNDPEAFPEVEVSLEQFSAVWLKAVHSLAA
jgi:hypothetical protein